MARPKKIKQDKQIENKKAEEAFNNSALDLLNNIDKPLKKNIVEKPKVVIDKKIEKDELKKVKKLKSIKKSPKPKLDIIIDYITMVHTYGDPFFLKQDYIVSNKAYYPNLNKCEVGSLLGEAKANHRNSRFALIQSYANKTKADYICYIDRKYKIKNYVNFKDLINKNPNLDFIYINEDFFLIKTEKAKQIKYNSFGEVKNNIKNITKNLETLILGTL